MSDLRWSCLDEPAPGRADPLVPMIDFTLGVADSITEAPPAGLLGRACSRLDVMCETPLTPDVAVAPDGALHFSVRQEFDGFIELRSPSTVPTMFYINRPLMRDTQDAIVVVSTLALGGLAAGGNVVLDPTLGNVLIRVFDCQGAPANGVELANDLGGQVFTFVNGLPVVGTAVTSPDGVGGFINVPPRYAVLQGIVAASGREVGTVSVTVRAGWFSYGDVAPATN